jgi:hypothetical protein
MLHAVITGDSPKAKEMAASKRWLAKITYLDGSFTRYPFDEFEHLGDFIEQGPDWNMIRAISVTLSQRPQLGAETHEPF